MPERTFELRVHGVAATPPEAMLDLVAEPLTDPCRPVAVHRRPALDRDVLAFSWGGLTSGRWWHALWLLLLPFMLANLAGWTLVPCEGRTRRALVGLVRCLGMLVTGLVSGVLFLLLVDLLGWQAAGGRGGWGAPTGMAVAGGVLVGVWWATRVRLRPAGGRFDVANRVRARLWADPTDPAGAVRLHRGQSELWNHPGLIEVLRFLHLGFGLAVVGALGLTAAAVHPAAAWAAPAVLFAGVGLLPGGGAPVSRGVSALARVSPVIGTAALAAGAASLARIDCGDCPPVLPGARGSLVVGALGLVGLTLVGWVTQLLRRGGLPARMASPTPALLLAALGSVVVAGLGAAQLTARRFPVVIGPLFDWLAFVDTAIVACLSAASLAAVLRAGRRADPALGSRGMQGLREVVRRPARLTAWFAAIPPVVLVAAFLTGPDVDRVPWLLAFPIGLAVYAPPAVAVAALLTRAGLSPRVAALASAGLATAVVAVVASTDLQVEVAGVALLPQTLRDVSLAIGVAGPGLLVGSRLLAALRDAEVRRGVGILFDLALFWPRWFHPFTPPTYSDRAVTELAETVLRLARRAPVVVSAHSQGSVIAAAALLLAAEGPDVGRLDRVGLVTHGSPLGRLYAELFPAVVRSEELAGVADALRDADGSVRWRNLHRATDPIGGPIREEGQGWLDDPAPPLALEHPTVSLERAWDRERGDADPRSWFHSRYTREPGHRVAVEAVRPIP